MINKLEKIEVVIDKVIRDLGLGHNEIPYADFIEWSAEALLHIGAYEQFLEKECTIVIEDYEGKFPCDLHKVKRIKRGMEVHCDSTGGYWAGTLQNTLSELGFDFDKLGAYDRYVVLNDPGLRRVDNINPYDSIVNRLQKNSNLVGDPKRNKATNLDYDVNFDKIRTSFPNGFIEVQYLAFPIDENGYPLVPDDQSFRDALFWKIAMQLCLRDPEIFRNKQLQNFEYVRQKWNFYCLQARANANMADIHGMERIKNNWLSLVPRYNAELNDYNELGKSQFVNFDRGR